LECEIESCSFSIFTYKINMSIKLTDYKLTNNQSKPDTVHIDLPLFVSDWAERLEKLVEVLLLYTNSLVYYLNQNFLRPFGLQKFYDDKDLTSAIRELDGVRVEV
jgi:hypothetical protein